MDTNKYSKKKLEMYLPNDDLTTNGSLNIKFSCLLFHIHRTEVVLLALSLSDMRQFQSSI